MYFPLVGLRFECFGRLVIMSLGVLYGGVNLLTYIFISYIILTKIIIIFNCYGVMVTQLTTFVPLYSCNYSGVC